MMSKVWRPLLTRKSSLLHSLSRRVATCTSRCKKLTELIRLMKKEQMDAYLIPTGDPHLGTSSLQ